jgi:hypothetical protein
MAAVPLQAPTPPAAQDPMAAAADWQPVPGDPTVSARPDEPVTAGLSTGAGPGPEVLPQVGAPDDPDLERLLPLLPLLERIASNPDATVGTRVFYRTLLTAKLAKEQ